MEDQILLLILIMKNDNRFSEGNIASIGFPWAAKHAVACFHIEFSSSVHDKFKILLI